MNTPWSRWLKRMKSAQAKTSAQKRRRVVLNLEALEPRDVPTTFTVTTTNDTNQLSPGSASPTDTSGTNISLRSALEALNAHPGTNDTIIVPAGHYLLTTAGGAGQGTAASLVVADANGVAIQGAGAAATLIDAQQLDRVMQITGGATDVSLQNLTIENGKAPVGNDPAGIIGFPDAAGGGILDEGHNLTLLDCVVTKNSASGFPGRSNNGGSGYGGGIYQYNPTDGTLTLTTSTVSDNGAYGGDGNEFYGSSPGNAYGGGINTRVGNLVIQSSSTVTGNLARGGLSGGEGGGNAFGGGVADEQGSLNQKPGVISDSVTISDSTVSGNGAYGGDGATGLTDDGGNAHGGGVYTNFGPLSILSSTLSGNQAVGGLAGAEGSSSALKTNAQTDAISNPPSFPLFGSGGDAYGGGLADELTQIGDDDLYLTVSDSTFSGNAAYGGAGGADGQGGDALGGNIYNATSAKVTNSTIAYGGATGGLDTATSQQGGSPGFAYGGGYYENAPDQTTTFGSTIVATNIATNGDGSTISGMGQDVYTTDTRNDKFITKGFNLIGDNDEAGDGFTDGVNHDLVGGTAAGDRGFTIDPLFDPTGLQPNGAPQAPLTLALQYNPSLGVVSPAIDQGSNQIVDPPFDERGPGFNRVVDIPGVPNAADGADIGAFEVQLPPPPPPPPPPPAPPPPAPPLPIVDPTFVSKTLLLGSGPFGAILDPNTLFANGLYQRLLGRAPDQNGLNQVVFLLDSGVPRAQIVDAFWRSPEHRGLQVDQYFQQFLNRAADPAGRAAWVSVFLNGASELDVETGILNSPEYQNAHAADNARVTPASLTTPAAYGSLVTQDYVTFLHRTPGASEVQGWVSLLVTGQVTQMQVGEDFLASDEFFANPV